MKIGDTVKLKSGGQPMTVCRMNGDEILCQWFAGGMLQSNSFSLCMLDVVATTVEGERGVADAAKKGFDTLYGGGGAEERSGS